MTRNIDPSPLSFSLGRARHRVPMYRVEPAVTGLAVKAMIHRFEETHDTDYRSFFR